MAFTLRNACTGTDETTVTTGNSGGSSGDAWDNIFIGSNATCVYETASLVVSPSCIRMSTGATSTTVTLLWTSASAVRQYGRVYWACGDYTNTRTVMRMRSGGTQTCRITVNSSGNVQIRNTADTVVATGSYTLAANTWYQFRWDISRGSSADATVSVYTSLSNTLLDTITATAQDFGGGTPGEVGFGIFTNTDNHPAQYIDEVCVTDAGPVGPVAQTAAVADTVTVADTVARSTSRSRAVADSVNAADASTAVVPQTLSNSADGGTDGVTVTTANSGGASGNPWGQINIGTGATCVYDSSQYARTPCSIRVSTGATASFAALFWLSSQTPIMTQTARSYGRVYWRCAGFTTNPKIVMLWDASSTWICKIYVDTAGKVNILPRLAGVTTGSVTLSANTWYRFAWDVAKGTSTGAASVSIYAADTETLLETISVSSVDLGSNNIAQVSFGIVDNSLTYANHPNLWLDGIAVSNAGPIGPLPLALSRSPADSVTVVDGPPYKLFNRANGGSNGTNVSTANSGGDSGNAWDVVNRGTGATNRYTSANWISGGLAYEFATAATSTTASLLWTAASIGASPGNTYYGRVYFRTGSFSANPAVVTSNDNSGNASFRITVSTGGLVEIRGALTAVKATGSMVLATDTWYRFEWVANFGASVNAEVRVYAGHGTTPVETVTATAQDFGTGPYTSIGIGVVSPTANHPSVYVDEIAVAVSGWIGPLEQNRSLSAGQPIADTVTAADTVTRVAAVTQLVADAVGASDTLFTGAEGDLPAAQAGRPAFTSAEYLIMITDRQLNILGNPITYWTSLDMTLRFNEPSTGMFVAPGWPGLRAQLVPGCRVVVVRYQEYQEQTQGRIVMGGPMENVLHERSDDGEHAGIGTVTVHFADDLAEVVARLTYQDPAVEPDEQTTSGWTFSGNAEVALRTLVDLNAGPDALPERQMPYLVLGALAGVGGSVDVTAELMEPMGELMRRIAVAGGGLGFRTRQDEGQIKFEVYQPVDRSATVRFAFTLGTAKYLGYEQTAPKATVVIVGGQGEDSDRFVTERVNTAAVSAWGRREVLLSRPGSTDLTVLQDDADKALAENDETARLQTAVADTATQKFGVHYFLGDVVAVETWPGEQLVDVVRGVHIQAWPTAGEVIQPMIGTQAASSDPVWIQHLRDINTRIGQLQRTVMPSS